jgi:hypothetical protein
MDRSPANISARRATNIDSDKLTIKETELIELAAEKMPTKKSATAASVPVSLLADVETSIDIMTANRDSRSHRRHRDWWKSRKW